MYAHIISKKELLKLPSASGMEIVNNSIYIIGDDSQYLTRVSTDGTIAESVQLFKNSATEGKRIPKKEKPDLEAITSFKSSGDIHLLIFGSGSKPNREICFLITLRDPFKNSHIEEISLKKFYDSLRKNDNITGGRKLNIEAAASNDGTLVLFQRGNKSGKNVALRFLLKDFIAFLKGGKIPKPEIHNFALPLLKGIPTGFSGAGFLPNSEIIIFTASAEDTESEIEDGKTHGSLLGIINNWDEVQCTPITWENGDEYSGKVESVAVLKEEEKGVFKVLAVTDDDLGGSDFLTIRFDTNL